MSHVRSAIRQAFAARLAAGNTAAGSRVHVNPTDPRVGFPALVVDDGGEQQLHGSMPMGPGGLVERELILDVTLELAQTGDWPTARDDLAAEVEALVLGTPIPYVRQIRLGGYQPDSAPGELPLATARQRFLLTYYTRAGDPSTAI